MHHLSEAGPFVMMIAGRSSVLNAGIATSGQVTLPPSGFELAQQLSLWILVIVSINFLSMLPRHPLTVICYLTEEGYWDPF